MDPWVWKIPQIRKWQPAAVFFTGKSQGQRKAMGYSPWGSKRVGFELATETTTTFSEKVLILTISGGGRARIVNQIVTRGM